MQTTRIMKKSNSPDHRDDTPQNRVFTVVFADCLVYEDAAILVVNKPPTLPTQPIQGPEEGFKKSPQQATSFLELAEKWTKQALFVVHRLDQPASGLVFFAKTAEAAAHLSQQFQDRSTTKIYWAVVEKRAWTSPNTEGVLVHHLAHNPKKNQSFVVAEKASKAKRAELHWLLRGSTDHYNLLEIKLLTGRHHQIRAQLSAFGCPIKGDVKYHAKRGNLDRSIHLHARFLRLKHPVSGELVEFEAAPPREVLWDLFANTPVL